MPRVKPHIWKLVPDDQRIGRNHNVAELICRSTVTTADIGVIYLDDLGEGIHTAVRPFLASRGIEVELWTAEDDPTLRANVYAGMRCVATLTCTEVHDTPLCADCGHPQVVHTVSGTACLTEGCRCDRYTKATTEVPDAD